MRFSTHTGMAKKQVTVEFDLDASGGFEQFYILINTDFGEEDIADYLPITSVNELQSKALRFFLEQAVDRNEQEILKNQG